MRRINARSCFALVAAFGGIEAYAPQRAMSLPSVGTTRRATSFVVPPSQQHFGIVGTTKDKLLSRFSSALSVSTDNETPPKTDVDSSGSGSDTSPLAAISDDKMVQLGIQAALVVAAAVATYFAATFAIGAATEFAANLSLAIRENFWEFLGNIPSAVGGLFVALFDFLKFFIPAVGKLGMSAYETAAPVVSETSQKVYEVAAPVIQDAAEKVSEVAAPVLEEATSRANEAAAPYVDQLNTAVNDAKGAVDAQVQGASKVMGDTVDAQIQGATKAVDASLAGASKAVGDVFDAQMQKLFP